MLSKVVYIWRNWYESLNRRLIREFSLGTRPRKIERMAAMHPTARWVLRDPNIASLYR